MNKNKRVVDDLFVDEVPVGLKSGWEKINLKDGKTIATLKHNAETAFRKNTEMKFVGYIGLIFVALAMVAIDAVASTVDMFAKKCGCLLLMSVFISIAVGTFFSLKAMYLNHTRNNDIICEYIDVIENFKIALSELNPLGTARIQAQNLTDEAIRNGLITLAQNLLRSENSQRFIKDHSEVLTTETVNRAKEEVEVRNRQFNKMWNRAKDSFDLFPGLEKREMFAIAGAKLSASK